MAHNPPFRVVEYPEFTRARAIYARLLSFGKSPDDPEVIAARHAMETAKLAAHIQHITNSSPLSDSERERLAALLAAGAE